MSDCTVLYNVFRSSSDNSIIVVLMFFWVTRQLRFVPFKKLSELRPQLASFSRLPPQLHYATVGMKFITDINCFVKYFSTSSMFWICIFTSLNVINVYCFWPRHLLRHFNYRIDFGWRLRYTRISRNYESGFAK